MSEKIGIRKDSLDICRIDDVLNEMRINIVEINRYRPSLARKASDI
jgi:hypothetical protein